MAQTSTTSTRLAPLMYHLSSPPTAHTLPLPLAHVDHDYATKLLRSRPHANAKQAHEEAELSLSDEEMLVCDEDDSWSDAGISSQGARSTTTKSGSDPGDAGGGGGVGARHRQAASGARSRRLLSQEQSRVLYKILEKTHFPSTQLREAVAAQLGVSPRKVQVWFQNRRQVGKKRMIEAVQSAFSPFHPVASAHVSLEMLQEQLKATGKGKFSPYEDERTRAWRKHTVRLALNPSAQEEEESKAAIAELERQQTRGYHHHQHQQPQYHTQLHPHPHSHHFHHHHQHHHQQQQQQQFVHQHKVAAGNFAEGRSRAMHSMARSVGSLRINVPLSYPSAAPLSSAKTPTYTGPGSATHLETLSATRALPPLTPSAARSSNVMPPAIVTSQKESFTLYNHHHHPPAHPAHPAHPAQPLHQQMQGGYARSRSQTLATPAGVHTETSGRIAGGGGGVGMREVRGSLTVDWHQKQRTYELQQYREEAGYQSQSLRGAHQAQQQQQQQSRLRYRSSTDALPRSSMAMALPLPLPSPPQLGRRERYSPYSRPQELAPPTPSRRATPAGSGGAFLLRPSLAPGRGRSVSSPQRFPTHPPPLQQYQQRAQGGRGHASQLSHSSSSTSTMVSRGWPNSATPTPTTASSTTAPAGDAVSPSRASPSHTLATPATANAPVNKTEENVNRTADKDRENSSEAKREDPRLSPMDVRSLTSFNLAPSANSATVTASSG